jgi:hypothetical protein
MIDLNKINLDLKELEKITLNRMLYATNKRDYFEIEEVLEMLDMETLPIDIPINNNQVFIRDLTKYMVNNSLKPNIYEE